MPKQKSKDVKPDFSVKLPDNVAAQGEKADEALAKLAGDPEPIKVEEPAVEEPKKLEPTHPEPDKPTSFVPPEPAIAVEEVKADDQDWQHKYKVLDGKYTKELGDLRQGVKNLNTVIQQQSNLIEQLQAAPSVQSAPQGQVATTTPAVDEINIKKLDSDDFASYGDEIVWLVKGFNKLIDQNNALSTKLNAGSTAGGEGRLDRVEKMVHETASDRYMGHLDNAIPNWRSVNDSAEFKAWLATIDDVTGHRYNDVMRYAANNLKHPQVIALFGRYAAEKNVDLGIAKPSPAIPQTFIKREGGIIDETVDPLASMEMPDTSTGGSDGPGMGDAIPAPTSKDVSNASALYAKGKIKIEEFNEISNRFQMGQAALAKQNG